MNEIKLSSWEPSPIGLSLFSQKKKVLLLIVIVSVISMAPLIVKNMLQGYYLLAASLVGFLSILLIDALYVLRKQPAPFHYCVVASALTVTLLLSEFYLGVIGLFWIFPAIVALAFVLPTRVGYFFNALIVAASSVIAYIQIDLMIAARFTAALIFVVLISTIALNAIKSLVDQLIDQSVKDPLTGVFNRRQLLFYLDDCIEQHRVFNTLATVSLFDIDHFKTINDELGHVAGDQLIQQVSETIRTHSNTSDLLFRIGGDEFLLLSPDTTNEEAVEQAQEIRTAIASNPLPKGLPLSVSIGIAGIDHDVDNEQWIKNADSALFEAKRKGKNRIEVYSDADQKPQRTILATKQAH